jgi:hypothetical protein
LHEIYEGIWVHMQMDIWWLDRSRELDIFGWHWRKIA